MVGVRVSLETMSPRKKNNPIKGFSKLVMKATEELTDNVLDAVKGGDDDKKTERTRDWTTGTPKPPPKRR